MIALQTSGKRRRHRNKLGSDAAIRYNEWLERDMIAVPIGPHTTLCLCCRTPRQPLFDRNMHVLSDASAAAC
ncbi:hypothetical protein [Bradyrhizobium sp. 5.13L]